MSHFFIYKLSEPFQTESRFTLYCRSDLYNSFVQMSILYHFQVIENISIMFMFRSSYTKPIKRIRVHSILPLWFFVRLLCTNVNSLPIQVISLICLCFEVLTCHTSLFINCRNGFSESEFIAFFRSVGDGKEVSPDCGGSWWQEECTGLSWLWTTLEWTLDKHRQHTYTYLQPCHSPPPPTACIQHYAGNACKPLPPSCPTHF